MKILLAFIVLVSSSLTWAHCPLAFSGSGLCGNVEWVSGPFINKPSHFTLTFWKNGDSTHQPINVEQELKVYSWMTMGHGHAHGGPKMTLVKLSDGIYEVRDAKFFMGGMDGYWDVRVDLLQQGQLLDRAASRVKFQE